MDEESRMLDEGCPNDPPKERLSYSNTCCRWAEDRFGIENVIDVDFTEVYEEQYEWSEYTIEPGRAYVLVSIKDKKGSLHRQEVGDLGQLIQEICTFSQ